MEEDLIGTRWGNLEFGEAQVYVRGERLGVRASRQFRFPDGKRERFVSFGKFYARIPDAAAAESALTMLNSEKFDAARVKIVPLTTNTATLSELKATSKASLVEGPIGSVDDLRRVFRGAPGSLVVVLGHFEGGAFVVNDAGGKELLRASLQELSAIASESGVGLIPLGCHSAGVGGGGSATKFNTLVAAKRLGGALKSETYEGFFQTIGGDDLEFIFDPASTASLRRNEGNAVVLEGYATGPKELPGKIERTATIGVQLPRPQPVAVPPSSSSSPAGSGTIGGTDGSTPTTSEISKSEPQSSWYGLGGLGAVAVLAAGCMGVALRRRAAARRDTL